ncbi:MAG: TerB family tellurite resistance protein [Deltaproteobacteria bacterium]|nr:TerB family tellurite resistance protein [Deltaproteobacteria bacterium]
MALTETHAVAALRLVVAVAKADDELAPEERAQLEAALSALPLGGLSVDQLIAQPVDIEAQFKLLDTDEAREHAWGAMYAMAWADGQCVPMEQVVLDRAQTVLGIEDTKVNGLHRLYNEARDTVLPSSIEPIADPAKRDAEIREDTLKYSILSAILGAFPVPGLALLTDLAVIGVQVKLVRDIGQYWGHKVDQSAAKSLLYGLGLGTGARLAVNNFAKLVPGWGSAVGATTSFAATWALGKVANQYFANGAKDDPSVFVAAFRSAEKEGKAEFESHQGEIAAKQQLAQDRLRQLAEDAKAGRISQQQYQAKVAEL